MPRHAEELRLPSTSPGFQDLRRAADQLAARLPYALAPLARIAYNYRWSWTTDGDSLFAEIDCDRWVRCGHNPVRLLQEASTAALERAAGDADLCRRVYALEPRVFEPGGTSAFPGIAPDRPVAFFCAEFGVHASLPIYAGGLGVLAGDLLKAASDAALPLVAVGLLYRQGYFRQRIDVTGWQHEYWVDTDPERLPAALVTRDGREPLTVSVPIRGRAVVAQIWRVDVGRVPLYLLDPDRSENHPVDRWIASRLYVGDRDTRLAQYALLGLGGACALRAMGFEPSVLHLNEGHAGLAPLELAGGYVDAGATFEEALAAARSRTVFTTHTPVPAGNETYAPDQIVRIFSGLEKRLQCDWGDILRLGRVNSDDPNESPGMTVLGLRLSRSANGVSERHGGVSRAMWAPVFAGRPARDVPIGHVTNGVHLGTWVAQPIRALLDRYLGQDWEQRGADPETWQKIDDVPDADLWDARCRLRARLVEYVRDRATRDRLARGEPPEYVELATRAFDPERLTLGFARRLATYKRLHLLTSHLPRALQLLAGERPLQILLAGKAHPMDDGAKAVVSTLFQAKGAPHVGERIAYLHDYDMQIAKELVTGCDVWVNLPRPPLEASGTSGMKACMNGALSLSVLDGWWAEAYDGKNGWAIDGTEMEDHAAQDAQDATALLDRIENEIVPSFYERDADGVPRAWVRMMKASIRTVGQGFSARRMVRDYVAKVYAPV